MIGGGGRWGDGDMDHLVVAAVFELGWGGAGSILPEGGRREVRSALIKDVRSAGFLTHFLQGLLVGGAAMEVDEAVDGL